MPTSPSDLFVRERVYLGDACPLEVWANTLTAYAVETWEDAVASPAGGLRDDLPYGIRPTLVQIGATDADGNLLWRGDQLAEIAQMPAWIVKAIFEHITRLNRMQESDKKALAGNSGAGQAGS